MLEKENHVSDYFDNVSFKQAINYLKNGVNQTMNSNTTLSNDNDGHNVLINYVLLWKTWGNIERMKAVPRGSTIIVLYIYDVILIYIICKSNIF